MNLAASEHRKATAWPKSPGSPTVSVGTFLAAASTVAFAFIFYDFGWTHAFVSESVATSLDAISLHQRFAHMSEGLVMLSDLAYFAAAALISGVLTRLCFELRRAGV